jgi:hypothetical protein
MSKVNTNKTETTTPTAKRGRPTVEGSKRQAVLAMRAAKVAAGGEIKRGRPAGTKKTTDVTVEVNAKVSKPAKSKAQKQAEMAARKAASNEEREVVASEIELVEAGLM